MSRSGAPKSDNTAPLGAVIWICGVPASGKTTLAEKLCARLREAGHATLWLDSDDLRPVLTPFANYDEKGRDAFYAAVGHVAVLGAEGGAIVVVSATANRRRYREEVRGRVAGFVEIALMADEAVLRRERDIKGLYSKAAAGEIDALPGVDVPWESSELAELTVDTTTSAPETVFEQVFNFLNDHLGLHNGPQ